MPQRTLLTILFAFVVCPLAREAPAQTAAPSPGRARAAATRLAFYDDEGLADAGIDLKTDSRAEADMREFARGLDVNVFEVSRLVGFVFIVDYSLDLTEDFVEAFKHKSSRAPRLELPARRIPDAAVAFVNTDAFEDTAKGVTRLVNAANTIEREFAPRREEISQLKKRLGGAAGDEKKRLEAEIKKKSEAGQAAVEKRWKELTAPVFRDITAALKTFCKREGISLLFDLRKIKPGDKLSPDDAPLPSDAPDITEAFINAFNQGTL